MNRRRYKWVYLIIALAVCIVMVFPLYWAVISSLKTSLQLFQFPPSWIPPTPQWHTYLTVIGTQWPHLLTSVVLSLGSVVLSMVIALPAAYAVSQLRLKLGTAIIVVLLLVQMIPGISLANGFYLIFDKLGLLNSYQGLILADSTYSVPFNVLILVAFMSAQPKELFEAAWVDGATAWTALVRIMIPLAKAGVITASLFSCLFSWSDFLYGVTLTTSTSIQPITVSIYEYISAHIAEWNDLMAAAVLASIPAVILVLLAQRYITVGIANTGIK